jgi:hypothetical protein
VINPPAFSDPLPPLFGKASGWAYPRGNGEGFIGKVLTGNPLTTFIPGILPALEGGGYGITRAQMPEPPTKNIKVNSKGYSPIGYQVGTFVALLEDIIESSGGTI